MDLVHIWYEDKYWSKSLRRTIPNPLNDLKVKVMDLNFLCQSFTPKVLGPHYFQTLWWRLTMSVFAWLLMDLINVSHGDRYWSKILCGTFSIPVHDLKGKVADLEFLRKSFMLKFLQCKFLLC